MVFVMHRVTKPIKWIVADLLENVEKPQAGTVWKAVGLGLIGAGLLIRAIGVPASFALPPIALAVLLFVTRLHKWLYMAIVTAPRDIRGLLHLMRLRMFASSCLRNDVTVPKLFKGVARRHPDRVCFVDEDRPWTYREVDEYSNRLANAFLDCGYKQGDVVALFMESCPTFVCTWLGLSKIGIVAALINFNLRNESLVHSIISAQAKAVIFGSELTDAMEEVSNSLPAELTYFFHGDCDKLSFSADSIDSLMRTCSDDNPPKIEVKLTERLVLIYTSGTTGLPKAAVITHLRYIFMTAGIRFFFGITEDDILYDPLPLYHSAGGILGVGQAILFGTTVAIRRKFSASKFWDDCIKYKCTVTQYIGEICRYLLSQPARPQDKMHQIRLMFGNGLRPQNWISFQERFGVKQIGEFYGSTEGNANILNTENRVGAIGFVSRIAPFAYPCTLIRVDETGEVMRNSRGLCVKCKPGQPGEFVGRIANNPIRAFDGYVNKSATEKKIVTDVFTKGDACFLSGDVLVMDDYGFLYFVDRRGDTFRWKGENVSTAEIEGVISNVAGLKDSTVYGVEVPDTEGRAGMAAIVDADNSLNLDDLALGFQKSLPVYARPVFVRIMDSLPMTGTFKLKKVDLQKEGFNPSLCSNGRLYVLQSGKYVTLDERTYASINSGKIRL